MFNKPTRKRSKSFALLLAASLTAVGLTNVGTVARADSKSNIVNVGISGDIDKLDPHLATNFATVRVLGLVYSELVETTPQLQVVPALAKSWYWNSDSTQLRLYMRSGVKFQDGTPFTAADAKASLDRIMNPATGAASRSNLALVTSITASPDGGILTINFSAPDAPFLASLDGVNMAMLSKKDIAAGLIGKKVNGTGPYKFVSWTPGQSIKLATNSTYFKTVPSVAGITFQVIPSEASILAAMNAGTIDFAYVGDPLVAKQVGSNLTLYKQSSLSYHVLQLNATKAPLTNVNVRLAIQCAIDRQQVVDTAALGEGSITGPFTMPAYKSDTNAQPCPTANIAKAKAYLAAGGYPNGLTLPVITEGGEYALATPIAESVKAQLAKAGINMQITALDAATYIPKWLAGDFVAAVANNGGKVDPDTMYTRYFTSTGNLNKVAGYSSPTLDALFLQGKATGNVSQRSKIYAKITKELVNNAAWVWLFTPYDYYISAKNLTGYTPNPNGSMLELRNVKFTS
jgi:peptide/nickel transport system substrate-binding protein